MKINEIVIGSIKSENQKSAINNNKTLYKSREKVIEFFDNYSRMESEAKFKTTDGKVSKY